MTNALRRLRCALRWHRWSRWGSEDMRCAHGYSRTYASGFRHTYFATRFCQWCNWKQERATRAVWFEECAVDHRHHCDQVVTL